MGYGLWVMDGYGYGMRWGMGEWVQACNVMYVCMYF